MPGFFIEKFTPGKIHPDGMLGVELFAYSFYGYQMRLLFKSRMLLSSRLIFSFFPCYNISILRYLSHALILILSGLVSFSVVANETNATKTTRTELINALRNQFTSPFNEPFQVNFDWPRLRTFYKSRNYLPVWLDQHGPLPRAASLRQVLHAAEQEGLVYEDYYPDLITLRWKKRLPWKLAELELLLTDAFFRYSKHVQTGSQKPGMNEYYQDITPPEIDPVKGLNSLLKAEDFYKALQALTPQHEGYRRLHAALKQYQALAEQGGWPVIPRGPLLSLGTWHKQVAMIRQRLIAEGDLELTPVYHQRHFDQAIKFAVERFQVRYGLKMDGIVGPKTRAAMNVPVAERIKQITLNMDRWRWLPRQLGQRYIMVNTAGFELAVIKDNATQFTMGVIIGTPKRPTPVLKGQLHTVVLNPYWTVPKTIIFEDFIPQQLRDPNYLKSKGVRVFTNRSKAEELDPVEIDWTQVDEDYFPYILRQDPGDKNPLGRLKVLFSNTYDVYLHGTPDQYLFDKDSRAFSSGCIRVEQPVQLASYLLGEQNGWNKEKIKAAIASGNYQEISVSGKIPIYLVYMTSWVGENQGVHFRPDIYRWDANGPKCDARP